MSVSVDIGRIRPDEPEQPGLDVVEDPPRSPFEIYRLWAAACGECGPKVVEQRLRRFPGPDCAIRHPGGEMKHRRLQHHVPDEQVLKLGVCHPGGHAHGSSSLYAAYLAWAGAAA